MFDRFRRGDRECSDATASDVASRSVPPTARRPSIRALEPRFVFDAAAHAAADTAHAAAAAQAPAAAEKPAATPYHAIVSRTTDVHGTVVTERFDDIQAAGIAPATAPVSHEVVVIDANVPDIQTLLKGIPSTAEVIMIDPSRDGFDQLADALRGRTDIDAIHIISHGSAGDLRLGTSELTSDSIVGRYADDLATIGRAMTASGDLLIYGCDFAAGTVGAEAAQRLATATGADVAASTNATGDAALGGDWTLEVHDGPIESAVVVDREAQVEWHHVLAPPLTYVINGAPTVTDGANTSVTATHVTNGVTYYDVNANVVGATALWTNVGTVGGVSVNLKATVIGEGAADDGVSFATNGDDATILVRSTTSVTPPASQAGQIVIRWDIVRSDDGQPIAADIDLQIGDIDGVGGTPNTRETVTPSQTGLFTYTIDNPTDLVIDTLGDKVSASGTQNETVAPPAGVSVVGYHFTNVASYQVTYRLAANTVTGMAAFQNDGNQSLTLTNPQTFLVPKVDLDADDSSGATGYSYQTTYTEKGAGVSVSDVDPLVTNTAATVDSAEIILTNAKAGDELQVGTLPAGITSTIDTSVPGQITVTLTGASTPALYQDAIRAVTYDSTSADPDTTARLIDTRVTSNGVHGTSGRTTITVVAVNDAPVNIVPGAQTTAEDTALVFSTANGNALQVSDVDAEAGNLTTTVSVDRGTVTLGSATGVTVTGDGTASVTLSGTLAAINAALNGTAYRPAQDDTNPAVLTIATNDNGNTGTGGAKSDTDTVAITVTPVDDAPVNHLPVAQTTPEDTNLIFSTGNGNALTISDVDAGAGTLTTTLAVNRGTIALGSTTGVTVSGNGTGTVTLTGTITQINAALNGTAYRPAADDNGAITLQMSTNDNGNTGLGGPKTTTDTLAITVTPVDDAPVNHLPVAQTTPEDTNLVFSAANGNALTISDVDAGAGNLTTTLIASRGTIALGSTAGVTVSGNGTGTVTLTGTVTQINAALEGTAYRPLADDNGAITLQMSTNDNGNTGTGGPQIATNTLAITVTAVDDAPVNHLPAAQTTPEDTNLVFSAGNGNALTVSDVDAGTGNLTTTLTASRGTIALGSITGVTVTGNGTGTVTLTGTVAQINAALEGTAYRPVADDNGAITLRMSTNDNGNTGAGGPQIATNTLATTVAPVDDAPVNNVPVAQTTPEDTNLVFSVGTGNAITVSDVDAGAGNLTTTLVASRGTIALGSTAGVTVTGNGTATVTLTGTVAQINAALEGTAYQPAADDNGAITLQISTTDNSNTGTGGPQIATNTLAITVTAVDDAPVNHLPAAQTTPEDTNLVFSAGNGNALTVSDVDAGTGNLTTTLVASRGTIALGSTTGVTVTGNGTGTVTLTGTVAQIDAALEGTAYRPAADDNGTITLQMSTTDNGNTGAGGPQIANDTLAITVPAVDDAPANHLPAAQTTLEDTTLVFSSQTGNAITVSDVDAGAGDLLTTTIAADRGTILLGSTAGVTVTGNGTGSVTLTGTAAQINAALEGTAYRPAPDDNGTVALTVTTGDTGPSGPKSTTDVLAVSVTAVDDPPANHLPAAQTTPEDTALVFSSGNGNAITVSDVDAASGAPLTTTISVDRGTLLLGTTAGVTVSGNGTGRVTLTGTAAGINAALDGTAYRPAQDDNGTVTLTVTTSDTGPNGPQSTTDTLAIAVSAVNDAPEVRLPMPPTVRENTDFVFSSAAGNPLRIADVDAGSNPVTATISVTRGTLILGSRAGVTVLGDGTGTITLTGTVDAINAALDGTVYRPVRNDAGAIALTLTASDGFTGPGGPKTGTGTLVLTIDQPPQADPSPDQAATDSQAVLLDVSRAFRDGNGDPLTYSAAGTLPPGLVIDPATGIISGTIRPGASGPTGNRIYAVTITATDPQDASASTSFGWRIANIGPIAQDDVATVAQNGSAAIDVLKVGSPAGTPGRDTDPDGDPLTLVAAGPGAPTAQHGQVSVFGDHLIYVPDANFAGQDTIRYTIDDGNGGRASAIVTVTVTSTNRPPQVAANPVVTFEDRPFAGRVIARDPDGDAVAFRIAGQPGSGTLVLRPDGTYTYTPGPHFLGRDSFVIGVSDGRGGETLVTVPVTVAILPPAAPPPPPSPVPLSLLPIDNVLSVGAESPVTIRSLVATPLYPVGAGIAFDDDAFGADGPLSFARANAADSVVLRTIESIDSLHSVAAIPLGDRPITAAVNGIAPLGSLEIIPGRGAIQQEANRIARLADHLDRLADGRTSWFSTRPFLGRSLDLSFTDESRSGAVLPDLTVEAIRRHETLSLSVRGLEGGALEIERVEIFAIDGGPRPSWLATDGRGSFWGHPPAGVEQIDVEIVITTRHGTHASRAIRIDTSNGEVTAIKERHIDRTSAPLLSQQLAGIGQNDPRELHLIERALMSHLP